MTEVVYGPTKQCVQCRQVLDIELFPLARPRADGARGRYRFCVDCLVVRELGVPPEERDAAQRHAHREFRNRRRLQTGHW